MVVLPGLTSPPEWREEAGGKRLIFHPPDWIHFRLPNELSQRLPEFQKDLYRLLQFESPRFELKPDFAWIEKGKLTMAPINVMATHFSILHVALHQKDFHFQGTLYFQTGKGITVFGQDSTTLDLAPEGNHYVVRLVDEQHDLAIQWSIDSKVSQAIQQELPQEGTATLALFLLPTSLPRL